MSPRVSVVFSVSRLLKTFPAGSFDDQPMTPRWPATEGRCQTEVRRRSRDTSRFFSAFPTIHLRVSRRRVASLRQVFISDASLWSRRRRIIHLIWFSPRGARPVFPLAASGETHLAVTQHDKSLGANSPVFVFSLCFFFPNRLTRCWTINIQNPDTATIEAGCVTRWWWRGRRMMSYDYYDYTVGSKGSRLKLPATWSVTCFWQTGGNVWHICLFDVLLFFNSQKLRRETSRTKQDLPFIPLFSEQLWLLVFVWFQGFSFESFGFFATVSPLLKHETERKQFPL